VLFDDIAIMLFILFDSLFIYSFTDLFIASTRFAVWVLSVLQI